MGRRRCSNIYCIYVRIVYQSLCIGIPFPYTLRSAYERAFNSLRLNTATTCEPITSLNAGPDFFSVTSPQPINPQLICFIYTSVIYKRIDKSKKLASTLPSAAYFLQNTKKLSTDHSLAINFLVTLQEKLIISHTLQNMIIKNSEFTISSPSLSKCPEDTKAEYAFIGRSNVGKSSLINMLCNHKGLAKTSSKPGKTLLINHFIINNEWYLVDLPGYGYAKSSKTVRNKLEQMIAQYILQRKQLVNVFVLIDIRHEQQKIDREFVDWLGESNVPFSIIFTKADKLSPAKAKSNALLWNEKTTG